MLTVGAVLFFASLPEAFESACSPLVDSNNVNVDLPCGKVHFLRLCERMYAYITGSSAHDVWLI